MTSLQPLATDSGHFTIAALDHRDALKAELPGADDAALRAFKRDMLDALSVMEETPSGVMLEPEFSLPDLLDAVPEGAGVSCALEAQGYFSDPTAGNSLMPGWTPARVTEVGAHAAKLLVLYRHDQGSFTTAQERLVAEVVEGAAAANVPVMIEPVPVDVVDDVDRRTVILAAAERLNHLGPMLLKMPYPGAGACGDLTERCGDRPWALLSWGVAYDIYAEQVAEACGNGCSGFTVGRALWREAVDPETRTEFNKTILPARFAQLAELARTGRPYTDTSSNTASNGGSDS